jgi:hypothetical protein
MKGAKSDISRGQLHQALTKIRKQLTNSGQKHHDSEVNIESEE